MKKNGLFKIIMFVLLGVLLVTWLIPSGYFGGGEYVEISTAEVDPIGFFDFFQLIFMSFKYEYFIQTALLLVSIGALYGVLGKTGKYRALVERIASKFNGKEKVFLIVVAFIIAALTSVFDYSFSTFIFFPAIISIVLAMKYDKITALLTTFGAYFVGVIGSTINLNIVGTINGVLSDLQLNSGIWYKVSLFVVSFALLAIFLIKAKKKKDAKELEDADMFIGDKYSNKYGVWPIVTVFSILFVLMIIGCTNWNTLFEIDVFSTMHENIMAVKIGNTPIFTYIFGAITAFGEWSYGEMAVMCLIASLLIGKMYRIKLSNVFASMAEGAKKILPSVLLVMLVYTVVFFCGNTMSYPTIANFILGATSKFNILFSSIAAILGSALHVDILYVAGYVIEQIAVKTSNHTLVALLIQGFYGLTMLAVPTSAMLVLGLSYLNVSYKEWMKKSYRFILGLLIILMAILILVSVL